MISNLLISTLLSLRAHKLRVFLTMIGIIIGITSVVTISTLGEGMKKQVMSATSANTNVVKLHYTMQDESSTGMMIYEEPDYSFSRVDLKKVRDIDGVETIYPQYGDGMMGDNLNIQLDYFGAKANIMVTSNRGQNKIKYGRDFDDRDINKDVIILNHDVFDTSLKMDDPGELIGKAVSINDYMYKVIGILEPFDYEALDNTEAMALDWNIVYSSFVSRASYNKLATSKAISGINFKLKEGADKQAIISQAVSTLSESHPDVKGIFKENDQEQKNQKQMEDAIGGITMFLMAVTAISLLVGGIGVMNIMYVSVTERKREIGIRRAIGAKPRMILMQFLLEAAFITLLGGLFGVGLGYLLSTAVGSFVDIVPVMTPSIFAISTLVSILTGIVFGIIPAISASRMDPIKAIYN
ncbi:ABC transporter permease [Enterococcus ureilyticus]|uniref:ABC transporter permease n=1 Tax=Enterococcus ureilyticus TaxID=1131292 RepID=A0A1E5HCK3_9ENTE|nr:ABC transporter permease [Enterococcus ureilyticus]MBM7687830.1 putative ABC transport system permease protein [Enterococcus ureilyticus]MBO0447027.1 ABC transporter permease [Enterococcus ureilyticus]OEG22669.1 ABC transporter permease [Enterococcus ureilyticus]